MFSDDNTYSKYRQERSELEYMNRDLSYIITDSLVIIYKTKLMTAKYSSCFSTCSGEQISTDSNSLSIASSIIRDETDLIPFTSLSERGWPNLWAAMEITPS